MYVDNFILNNITKTFNHSEVWITQNRCFVWNLTNQQYGIYPIYNFKKILDYAYWNWRPLAKNIMVPLAQKGPKNSL